MRLISGCCARATCSAKFLEPEVEHINQNNLEAPTGFEPVFAVRHALFQSDRLVARC
jgi:hypothetical protein